MSSNPARGMRDFLPEDIRKREYVIGVVREVYEKYGFEPLETPSVENLSTLTNKYGEEGDQLMYKILKRGAKLQKGLAKDDVTENDLADLALRYDLTVPLARVIANRSNDLPKFFRRYQIQPVWRADRPAKGRYREFYQCDADAIGSTSHLVEAELAKAAIEILERLGFTEFEFRINDRNLLFALLEAAGIAEERSTDALVSLDKLDKIGREKVFEEMLSRGITSESAEQFLGFFDEVEGQSNLVSITSMAKHVADIESGNKALKQVTEILAMVDSDYMKFDPSIARGLSYYTGAIFEIGLKTDEYNFSVAGGGRYDGLIGMFGKQEIPAVGVSLGLERLIVVMDELGMFPDEATGSSVQALVTAWSEETTGVALKLASRLRDQGVSCIVYPKADKLGKQFKYADQIGVRFVLIQGEQELADGTVSVKNLKSGEQETVSVDDVVGMIGKQ